MHLPDQGGLKVAVTVSVVEGLLDGPPTFSLGAGPLVASTFKTTVLLTPANLRNVAGMLIVAADYCDQLEQLEQLEEDESDG